MSETAPAAEPTDDQRMRAAVELAASGTSPAATSLLRRRRIVVRRRMVIGLVAAVVIGGVVGVFMAVNDVHLTRRPALPVWRLVAGWTVWTAGVVSCVVFVVRAVRSGWYRRQRDRVQPLDVLTAAQRTFLVRQLKGRAAVVPAQLPLLRLVAESVVGAQPVQQMFGAIVLVLVGNAIRSGSIAFGVPAVVLTVVFVVGTVLNRSLRERARSLLAAHPAPTTEPSDV